MAKTDYEIATESLLKGLLSGNPNVANRTRLGPMVPIRLFQAVRLIALGSTLEKMIGPGSRALVYQSGQALGQVLGGAVLPQVPPKDLNSYVKEIAKLCRQLAIGVVIPETVDLAEQRFVLNVDECVSCAGIDGVNAPICHFEAGMVGGIVRVFLGSDVKAMEVKCAAVGDKTCAVEVRGL